MESPGTRLSIVAITATERTMVRPGSSRPRDFRPSNSVNTLSMTKNSYSEPEYMRSPLAVQPIILVKLISLSDHLA
jgi:hypothetical protein